MNEARFLDLASQWEADAKVRSSKYGGDPVANALAVCAAELRELVARETANPLTPGEFAIKAGVTEQTVTEWCRRGRIEAYRDPSGHWRIPPHVEPRRAAA